MKTSIRLFASFFLLLTFASFVHAQGGVNSSGTDYWLGFMPNGSPPGFSSVYQTLFIASGTDNKVTVSIGGAIRGTLTLTAGQVYDFPVTGNMTITPEVATPNAIHITSTNPITVYGYSAWGNPQGIGDSPDGFLALPTTALGTHYFTVNFPDNYVFGRCPGEFLITSPYDGNSITINPACDTKAGHSAHVPWSVTLNKGETYLVQSPGTDFGNNDLTGTSISSTKPISVLTGHEISSVPTDYGNSADNLFEMIPSVDRWGYQYFDEPMAGKIVCGDYIRVLSGENGNEITYTGDQSGVHGPVLLDSGQYTDITEQTEAMVFTSTNNKKFIVAQYSYSQGYDSDPGQSDPWMVLFTPQQQFEKTMIFRTPSSLKGAFKNYLTIIGRDDSLKKITINGAPLGTFPFVGHATFPGTSPAMGAWRITLGGGVNSYIARSPVPFGAYQYGFSNYEGYGWPTGMAQGIVSPDTLPPLMTILDSSCGTYHLQFIEPRNKPKFSFLDTKIAYIGLITTTGDLRWPTPSYNYSFDLASNFDVGDSVTTGTLTVNDRTKDAYAAVYAVDRAGNDTVYQFYYYAPKISMAPSPIYDFGEVVLDQDSCRTINLTNVQTSGEFGVDSTAIMGVATGGYFTVSPNGAAKIPAGQTIQLQICFHPTDILKASVDTLIVYSHCAEWHFPLTGTGITPLIFANDLNFGVVDSGKSSCKPLIVRNPGEAPLTITQQDLVNDPDFSVDPNQTFPIIIPPGGQVAITFCFHPQSYGNFSRRVTFINLNPSRFQHSIKDTSLLTGISLQSAVKWTSYQKSFTVSCTDTVLQDSLYNDKQKAISIDAVTLNGPDASYFQIVTQPGSYPIQITPGGAPIPYEIKFKPTANGFDFTPRTVTVVAEITGEGTGPSVSITGQLVAPVVAVSTASIDLGSTLVNQTLKGNFTISDTGNAPVTITSYNLSGPDAGAFTLTPAPPFTIQPGGSQVVNVSATSAQVGSITTTVTAMGPCNQQQTSLTASFSSVGLAAQGTTHPKTFTGGCRSNTQNASLTNQGSKYPITIQSVAFAAVNGWNNPVDFSTSFATPVTVGPGETVQVPVVFTPKATGLRQAAIEFVVLGKDSTGADTLWTIDRLVQGNGVDVHRTFAVGSVMVPPTYHSNANQTVNVPIVIDTAIDQNMPDNGTNEAYGYQFDLSWKRDAFQYQTVTPSSIQLTNTTYNAATGVETRSFKYISPTPIANAGTTVGTIGLGVMVTKQDTTPIVLSNAAWLGQDGTPLCYASDKMLSGQFNLDPKCGNATLQTILNGGSVGIEGIYPNPVTTSATIGYSLPTPSQVTISVFDLMGHEAARPLNNELQTAGVHEVMLQTDYLPSGTYYCRITDGRFVMTKQFEIQK